MRRVYGRKVTRITRGGLSTCLVLPAPQGVGMGWQKSAEAIVAGANHPGEGPNAKCGLGGSNFDDAEGSRSPG